MLYILFCFFQNFYYKVSHFYFHSILFYLKFVCTFIHFLYFHSWFNYFKLIFLVIKQVSWCISEASEFWQCCIFNVIKNDPLPSVYRTDRRLHCVLSTLNTNAKLIVSSRIKFYKNHTLLLAVNLGNFYFFNHQTLFFFPFTIKCNLRSIFHIWSADMWADWSSRLRWIHQARY